MNKDTSEYNCEHYKYPKTVDVPISLYESLQDRYFVGQTGKLFAGNGLSSWASLVNPCNSDINLFTNVFTVSNYSDDILVAELWLNTELHHCGYESHKVSPTNTSEKPYPKNKAEIRYEEATTILPDCGVNVYERIIPPNVTLVSEEDGKFIAAPGGNYTLIIKSESDKLDKVIVAFGWWEKKRER